jgi:hypothetical protein
MLPLLFASSHIVLGFDLQLLDLLILPYPAPFSGMDGAKNN